MADLEQLAEEHDTSVAIVRAIAQQRGDDADAIAEALENPEDYDAIIASARRNKDEDETLRWKGRMIP